MSSLTQFPIAAPTPPPLGLYDLSGGFTRLGTTQPSVFSAVGRLLQRIFSLTTTASTLSFKWLSLGNFSRVQSNLPTTPTTELYLEPTATLTTSNNTGPAFISIFPLVFLLSFLFGAGLLHFGRSDKHSTPLLTVENQRTGSERLPSKSPTVFNQDNADHPLPSRFSFFWVSALNFFLRCLAFLSRFIYVEKLLDTDDDNSAGQTIATNTNRRIAELRTLDRRSVRAMAIESPDGNKTLVAPFTPEIVKSKLSQALFSSAGDKVEIILPPKDVACSPTCIEIDPASTRKEPISPAIIAVSGELADPFAGGDAGATHSGLPTSNRRSFVRNRWSTPPDPIISPFSVEPSGVPDKTSAISIPSSNPSHKFSRSIQLTRDSPSTSSRRNVSATSSVEPSGVPDKVVAYSAKSNPQNLHAAPRPRPESIYQAKVRQIFKKYLDDSPQPHDSKSPPRNLDSTQTRNNVSATPSLEPCGVPNKLVTSDEPHAESTYQAKLRHIKYLKDPPSKSTPQTLDATPNSHSESIHQAEGRASPSVRSLDPPQKIDTTVDNRSPKDASTLASTRLFAVVEANQPQLSTDGSQNDNTPTHHNQKDVRLESTRDKLELSGSSADVVVNQSQLLGVSQKDPPSARYSSKGVRLLTMDRFSGKSTRLSTDPDTNRLTTDVQKNSATHHSSREVQPLTRHQLTSTRPSTDEEIDQPPHLPRTPPKTSQAQAQNSEPKPTPKDDKALETDPNLFETLDVLRERIQKSIERSREEATAFETRMRTKYPRRELGSAEQPRRPKSISRDNDSDAVCEETPRDKALKILGKIRKDHEHMLGRVNAKLKYHDEKRELREKSLSSRLQERTSPSYEPPVSTLPSKFRPLTKLSESTRLRIAQLNSVLDKPVADHGNETKSAESVVEESAETNEDTMEGYLPAASDDECHSGGTVEENCSSPVESSRRIEDNIPAVADDETQYEKRSLKIGGSSKASTKNRLASPTTPIRSTLFKPRDTPDLPQKIEDIFYTPTSAPCTPKRSNTSFLKNEKLTGFGFGSPGNRRIQRLDPKDTFYTSTPRVNHAHLGGFCTSTPRRGVDHRKDTWADFF